MLNANEIKSLVSLLDDDDPEILQHIESKILELGQDIIPFLEAEWAQLKSIEHQQRIENIIHKIQFKNLLIEFNEWLNSPQQDLLHGVYLVAKYQYPDLQKQSISNIIDKIRLDIWLEMHMDLTPYEKIRIINYVFYNSFGFKGNTNEYHHPNNSFINKVLETKQGNPILLAIIYMLVAQNLNIPIFGVNLPQHFVLAYTEEKFTNFTTAHFNDIEKLIQPEGKILFYINAFNKGSVFSKANLEQFLKQINVEPKHEYFETCSNLDIVKRVLRNLVSSFEKQNKTGKKDEILQILYSLGEPPLSHFTEINPEE